MGNPNKDSNGATGDLTSPWDAHQAACDLSWEREARDATLAKQVVEAMAREMAKVHAHFQALLNDRGAAAMPTSLKMTSGALGFKVMDPFDWSKDKAINQRWQMWSGKARHALDAMEGDSEKTTGLTVKEWPRLSHGRIKRYSSVRRTMRNLRKMKKKASTIQKR